MWRILKWTLGIITVLALTFGGYIGFQLRHLISCQTAKGDDAIIAACTQALEHDRYDHGSAYNRGVAYFQKSQYELAIADFTRNLDIESWNDEAYYLRGLSYAELRKYDEAIGDYTKALEINPNSWRAHTSRGYGYAMKGDHDRAAIDAKKTIEMKPTVARPHLTIGLGLFAKKDNLGAITAFSQAIALDPNRSDPTTYRAWRLRGAAYASLKDYGRAIADFTAAIQHTPHDSFPLILRGDTLAETKKLTEARADYQAVLDKPDTDGAHDLARQGLAMIK